MSDAPRTAFCENCEKDMNLETDIYYPIGDAPRRTSVVLCDPCMTRAATLLYSETERKLKRKASRAVHASRRDDTKGVKP